MLAIPRKSGYHRVFQPHSLHRSSRGDHVCTGRCQHCCRRRLRPSHQERCPFNIHTARPAGHRCIRLVRRCTVPGIQIAGACLECRRCRYQTSCRAHGREARHRRTGPRQSLRERHPGVRCGAVVLPGLLRHGQAGCEGGGRCHQRIRKGLPGERLCARRRRDRGDAGDVRRRGLRPGRNDRRSGGQAQRSWMDGRSGRGMC